MAHIVFKLVIVQGITKSNHRFTEKRHVALILQILSNLSAFLTLKGGGGSRVRKFGNTILSDPKGLQRGPTFWSGFEAPNS